MTYNDYINTYDAMVSCGAYINEAMCSEHAIFGESYTNMRVRETDLYETLQAKLNSVAMQLDHESNSRHPNVAKIKKLQEIANNLNHTITLHAKRLEKYHTR